MDDQIAATLSERGISPLRTKVGWDVVCRHGDPTSVHDLLRVRAHQATSIVLMLTDKDDEELEASEGKVLNGATTRGLLALRHVLFAHRMDPDSGAGLNIDEKLRVVVQLSAPSKYVEAAQWTSSSGTEVVYPLDLSVFLNSLLFNCAQQPGPDLPRRRTHRAENGPHGRFGQGAPGDAQL